MGVVADEGVGTSVDEPMGLYALLGHGLQCVFTTPVQADKDDGGRVCLPKGLDVMDERIGGLLAYTRLVCEVGEVFEC